VVEPETRREVFLAQAESAAGRSPLYDKLWRRLADEPLVDGVVGELRWDTPLRLSGALNYLVLDGRASWDDVPAALTDEGEFLRRFMAEQGVQTNEVQRTWMLVPCFLWAAARAGAELVDLIELGPSAGLNLVWDRYRYRYAAGEWGRDDALLSLSGEERRPVPAGVLEYKLQVRGRIGVDRSPIDVTTDDGARLLECFVWPDQTARLDRLRHAIAALREDPPELRRGDLVESLPALLAERRLDALTLVWQTSVFGYLSAEQRNSVRRALTMAGSAGRLAFVEATHPRGSVRPRTHYGLFVTVWPGGERVELAHGDFHGAWLDWRG
jgi:hypothetical protein